MRNCRCACSCALAQMNACLCADCPLRARGPCPRDSARAYEHDRTRNPFDCGRLASIVAPKHVGTEHL
eukprot:12874105-Alexandrium_andersonii.AAC.1